MIRGDDFEEAALLAFRLNKLRDFYHVLHRMNMVGKDKQASEDQVDSVLASIKRYEQLKSVDFDVNAVKDLHDSEKSSRFRSLVLKLWQLDRAKLVTIIRRLNAKYEFCHLAQAIMRELFVSEDFFEPSELNSLFKVTEQVDEAEDGKKKIGEKTNEPIIDKNGKRKKLKTKVGERIDIKDALESLQVYQDKHYKRAERLLRSSHFVDYVLKQRSLFDGQFGEQTAGAKEVKNADEAVSKKKLRKRELKAKMKQQAN